MEKINKNKEEQQMKAQRTDRIGRIIGMLPSILKWIAIVSIVLMAIIMVNGGPHDVLQRVVAFIGAISLIAVGAAAAYYT